MPLTSVKEVFDEVIQDFTDYLKIKSEILQLKAAEKGSPVAAKTIYTSILVVLGGIVTSIALITAIFALALIFIENGTDPFNAIKGLTFGALCLLGLFLLIIFILLAIKDCFISKMTLSMINKVIDWQEQKEREISGQELSKAMTSEPKNFVQTNNNGKELL